MAAVVILAVAAAGRAAGAARTGGAIPAPVSVRVMPGDTLWGIAVEHAPAGIDPRVWIFRTEALNGLPGAALMPGEVLRLPPGSH
jgi:nucleoid-associated protein YgaU